MPLFPDHKRDGRDGTPPALVSVAEAVDNIAAEDRADRLARSILTQAHLEVVHDAPVAQQLSTRTIRRSVGRDQLASDSRSAWLGRTGQKRINPMLRINLVRLDKKEGIK